MDCGENGKREELICDEMSDRIVDTAEQLALSSGAENVTVRKILHALGITNRVFYNRFHNIDEVLSIVYEKMVLRIRAVIVSQFDPNGDFFGQIIDIVANTLKLSYENKMNLNQYVFENDSISQDNYIWWKTQIHKLIEFGKANGYVKEVNSEIMSYAIWCFIRGYNADAVGRGLPMDEAIEKFRYSFGLLLDGLRA